MTAAAAPRELTLNAEALLGAIRGRGGKIRHDELPGLPMGTTDCYFDLWDSGLVFEYVNPVDGIRYVWCKPAPRRESKGVLSKPGPRIHVGM